MCAFFLWFLQLCVCFSLLADVIVFVFCNVHTRNRNAVAIPGHRLPWMHSTLKTLVDVPAGVGLSEYGKQVSTADTRSQTFTSALLVAEEAAIRSINDHIAAMPA